jgi:hypothetical protein
MSKQHSATKRHRRPKSMILAVFFAIVAAQKHADCRLPEVDVEGKVLGLHSAVFSERDQANT